MKLLSRSVHISISRDQVFQHKLATSSKSIKELGKQTKQTNKRNHLILHYPKTTLNHSYGPAFVILFVKYNINIRLTTVQVKT